MRRSCCGYLLTLLGIVLLAGSAEAQRPPRFEPPTAEQRARFARQRLHDARAELDAENVESAVRALADHDANLRHATRMRVNWILHGVTGEPEYLDSAQRLLGELRENSPEQYRETMITEVPLHREISATVEGF